MLTRRRSDNFRQETWHVYYDDVRVGTISERAGAPVEVVQSKWSRGFYPGQHRPERRQALRKLATALRRTGKASRLRCLKVLSMNGAITGIGLGRKTTVGSNSATLVIHRRRSLT